MHKLFFLALLFLLTTILQSQNLVPNPSFETFEECPYEVNFKSKKQIIPFWYMPNRGTTDYFNSCTLRQVNVPNNVMGSMFALDGEAYAGIILIESPGTKEKKLVNYREYLQAQLKKPLKKDSLYCIKFYYSIATYSHYTVNRLGAYISKEQIKKRTSTKVIELTPQVAIDTAKVVIERDYWHQVCGIYKASGGEKFITIGNFYNDNNTIYAPLDYSKFRNSIQQIIKANKIAYYYIDVVSVIPVNSLKQECCKDKFIKK